MKCRICKLGDVADITKLAGFEYTKYISYVEDGEIIALRALNLRNGELDLTDIKKISKNVSEQLIRSKLFSNDILLTYTGNGYGDCAFITENDKYHLAPNICKITPKRDIINSYYLYTFIRSNTFRMTLTNYIGGSSQPTIPMRTLRMLEIPYFDIYIQDKIAEYIYAIDEKIRTNTAINKNLEEQAQAIFKSWFVNFEPFGGEMPTDWRKGIADEILDFHDAKRVPLSGSEREKMDKIYPYYGATSLMDYVDNYIFEGIYLLFGEDGTVITKEGFPVLQYVDGKFWVNNHAHILTGKLGFSVEELYLLFSLTNIKSIVTGAVQPKVSQTNLKKISVVIPPIDLLKEFDGIIQPMFENIRIGRAENEQLTAIRDALLPRLMSGEIDVENMVVSPLCCNAQEFVI